MTYATPSMAARRMVQPEVIITITGCRTASGAVMMERTITLGISVGAGDRFTASLPTYWAGHYRQQHSLLISNAGADARK